MDKNQSVKNNSARDKLQADILAALQHMNFRDDGAPSQQSNKANEVNQTNKQNELNSAQKQTQASNNSTNVSTTFEILRKINAFKYLHSGFCDGCMEPIFGKRYDCSECKTYCFCEFCKNKGVHKEHQLKEAVKASPSECVDDSKFRDVKRILPFQNLHNAFCQNCGGPIYGTRYKCNKCFDYDLCESCFTGGAHQEHNFKRIENYAPPDGINNKYFETIKNDFSFHYLKLAYCGKCYGPIFGTKYMCQQCPNFCLCTKCKVRGTHDHHRFVIE